MERNPLVFKEGYITSFDGISLYYNLYGRGNTYLILNDGIACDMFVWKYLITYFHPFFKIVRWNYRGHGKSEKPPDKKNIPFFDLIRDLRAIILALGIEKGIFLGHSMGVQVILEYYRNYPENVLALIPVCGSFGYPLDTFFNSDLFKRLLPLMKKALAYNKKLFEGIWQILFESELTFSLGRMIELNPKRSKREDMMPYFRHVANLDLEVFFTMLLSTAEHSAFDVLHTIKVPTLIFAGKKDHFTPLWISEIMHQTIKDSQLCIIEEGGHASPVEFPEIIHLCLEKFLKHHHLFPIQREVCCE